MSQYWKCPHCGKIYSKSLTYGPVSGRSGMYEARGTYHANVSCNCGTTIPGGEIAAGHHDTSAVELARLLPWIAAILGGILAIAVFAIEYDSLPFWITVAVFAGLGFFWRQRIYKRIS